MKTQWILGLMAASVFASCGGEQKDGENKENKDTLAVKDTVPAYVYKHEVMEETVAPSWWINVGDSTNMASIHDFFMKNFTEVGTFAGKNKMAEAPMMGMFTNWDETKNFYARAGRTVTDSTLKVKGKMKLEKFYAGKAVKVHLVGPYDMQLFGAAYGDLDHYMGEKGLTANGDPWEVYIKNPGNEKDSTKYETDIFIPVK